ncbi:hypothetical protein O181_037241 [Austropuccinia psidii MF-1]|uniref:Uncharacterized protein n=1 Tax=Austropuccinia psidii MF-1 TaxID=1389203 RepID=A0A9Q3DBQ1_9BASI|nr:hypothetical protein [Austropuccinia psidii MF-1]
MVDEIQPIKPDPDDSSRMVDESLASSESGASDDADLRPAKTPRIKVIDNFIFLDQQHFTKALIELYGMEKCKPLVTPLPPQTHLVPASEEDLSKFKELNFLENPGIQNWNGFLHALKYLNQTQNMGLVYSCESKEGIRVYSNTDRVNCQETRRSVTGFLVTFEQSLVIWKTRKQPTVSISTSKAEYKALCDLTSELSWFCQWCLECSLNNNDEAIPVH